MKGLSLLALLIFGCARLTYADVVYVDHSASGSNNGSSWANAYTNLKTALNAAGSGDEIWVAEGTYYPSVTDNPNETFFMPCGVSLYGGFSGVETLRNQRNWDDHPTILSGEIGDPNDITDNSNGMVSVPACNTPMVLSGFRITGGYTTGSTAVIAVNDNQDFQVRQCVVEGNTMAAAVSCGASNVLLRNCLFAGNDFGLNAIGLSGIQGSLTAINITVADNASLGFFSQGNFGAPPMVIRNSVFWNSDGPPSLGSVCAELTNCIVHGAYSVQTVENVVEVDPQFVDPLNGNYQLLSGSPAEDSGDNAFSNQGYDLARSYRILGSSVDMGCYERRIPTVLYVDQDANGLDVGLSWGDAFTDLAEALDMAVSGDELWVAEGTYFTPTIAGFQIVGKALSVYGGFDGTESQRNQRDWLEHHTVLSGELGDPASATDNALHVMNILLSNSDEGEFVLNGLEFERGHADSFGGLSFGGGGLLVSEANEITIRNCTFRDNYALEAGGAVYFNSCDGMLVSQCRFIDNTSVVGSALYSANTPLPNADRPYELQSCLFEGNIAFNTGTVYLSPGDLINLTNCTFYGNGVSFTPDAKIIDGVAQDETWTFANNILWENNILGANQEILDAGPNSIVLNSILQNPYSGNASNVFNLDPLFVNPANGDFSLQDGSPGINNGVGSVVDESLDLLRQPRVLNGAVDLGAIENELIADGVIYVDVDATGNNDGSSWTNAYTDIGEAIAASQSGNRIWIAEGVYTRQGPGAQGWSINNGVNLIGGFQGIEWEEEQANPALHETVISGDVGLDGDSSNDLMGMMLILDLNSFIKLSGLIFEEMNSTGPNAQPVLFFATSTAPLGSVGEILIERCVFRNSELGTEQFIGVNATASSPIVAQFDNCLIANNENDEFLLTAAGNSLIRMNHCTINYNSAQAAIGLSTAGAMEISNSIIWNEQGANVWANVGSLDVTVNASILPAAQLNFQGEDNLTGNPIFWNPAAGDFRLQQASPGVNSGNNNLTFVDVDLAGNARIQGGTVDRGCYESDYQDLGCEGDFDNDGLVGTNDLLLFLALFNSVCDGQPCEGDLTGDNIVSVSDLLVFLTLFGSECP